MKTSVLLSQIQLKISEARIMVEQIPEKQFTDEIGVFLSSFESMQDELSDIIMAKEMEGD